MQSTLGASPASAVNEDKHDPKTCPFCPDEGDKGINNKLVNNSSTLGTNCEQNDTLGNTKPEREEFCIIYKNPKTQEEDISAVSFQAHHCIPGNASMKSEKSSGYQHKILKYIEKDENTITDNIGYDINNYKNGIWLCNKPDHFIGRMKDGEWDIYPQSGMKWGALSKKHVDKQYKMAKASMMESNRQFHDSHGPYSKEVRRRLDDLMDDIKEEKMECPIEKDSKKPNVRPPFGLLIKLNGLSKNLAQDLNGPATNWSDPYFTSKFSKKLAKEVSQ